MCDCSRYYQRARAALRKGGEIKSPPLFTPEERSRLRSELLEYGAKDGRITGAAITGSAAVDCEDQWSDIDLAFGVIDAAAVQNVLSDWTRHMYGRHGALHHLDIRSGEWTYRVFLLPSTLQVDLAFVPATDFRALYPTFRLMFGTANPARLVAAPELDTSVRCRSAALHLFHKEDQRNHARRADREEHDDVDIRE